MSPKHIELIGLPGSGKSTIAGKLEATAPDDVQRLDRGYKKAVCRHSLPLIFSSPCRSAPKELVEMLGTLSGAHPKREQFDDFESLARFFLGSYTADTQRIRTVDAWIQTLLRRYGTAMGLLDRTDTILCDEGFLMRANAIFCPPRPITEIDPEDVREYLTGMPTPDHVVLLDVPVETAEERVRRRSEGPPRSFAGEGEDSMRRRFETMESFIRYTVSGLEEMDLPVDRVKNTRSMENTVEELTRVLA